MKKLLLLILFLISQPYVGIAEINSINDEFPEKPSLVPNKLLGVNRENWKTFGLSCRLLDEDISQCRETDKWGVIAGEIQGKGNWKDCLKQIQRVKEELIKFRKLKPEVIAYKDEIVKKTGKQFPLSTLNNGIYNHLNSKEDLKKNTLYGIDVFRCTYKILQLGEGRALYYDTDNQWPPILLTLPQGVDLQEESYINHFVAYYSFEGITSYTNINGFKRNAFVFKGYVDEEFRKIWIQLIKANQWINGNVNTKGM